MKNANQIIIGMTYQSSPAIFWYCPIPRTLLAIIKKTIPIKWTKEAVLKDAMKYKYKIDWKKNSSGARGAARKGGYYDEAVRHMTPK